VPPTAKLTAPKAAAAAVSAEPGKGFVVQAGAFSTRERAQGVASRIGGSVSSAGKLYRVRTGPFGSRKDAEASLAKVKAAGYGDARIYPTG
jgi:rare lipoprotein A